MSSNSDFADKLENLDLTEAEIDRLSTCMKDEKFRELFREYTEEISNPENKKKYEEEISLLEKERGMDVKFINPKPGHVIKTTNKAKEKCFINICTNDVLGKPKSQPSVQGQTRGMQWSIPHSVSQPRKDLDRSGGRCVVYDVVFHPDTYYMLTKNHRFKQMIHDTALDAVERRFEVSLDKENLKFPKMKFKGTPTSSIIRTPTDKAKQDSDSSCSTPEWLLKNKMPTTDKDKEKKSGEDGKNELNIKTIVPEYTMKHRGYFDMQDLSMIPSFRKSSRPKELVIAINLPKITSASAVNLDIFERVLRLKSCEPVQYKLEIKLPYPIDETKGFAKFDKKDRVLNVTLEVMEPEPVPDIIPMLKDERLAEYEKKKDQETKEENKVAEKKSTFTEENQLHYNEGANYCDDYNDDDEGESGDNAEAKFDRSTLPLIHTSEYLIKMIKKHHEGLLRKCPKYIYFQDDEYVTIVADIPHTYKDSVWYAIYDDKLQFVCLSECIEGELANSLISLWVFMEDGLLIDPSKSRIDISSSNVVIVLRKVGKKKWDQMKAGLDPQNLKTRLFTTNKNICELFTMSLDQSKNASPTPFVCCKANKNEKDFLLLDLEPKSAAKSAKVATDKENSAPQPNKQQGKEKTNNNNVASKKPPQQQQGAKTKTTTTTAAAVNGYNDEVVSGQIYRPQPPIPTEQQQQPSAAGSGDSNGLSLSEQLAKQMTLTESSGSSDDVIDSDDDEDDEVDKTEMVIAVGDKVEEVITNHKTSSAVKLSTSDMVFQLDDY